MKTHRSLASLLALGGLFCTLFLAACGGASSSSGASSASNDNSSAAPASTPAAPSSANTNFTSADGSYSLKYPDGWITGPINDANAQNATVFASADGKDMVITLPLDVQVDAANYSQLATAALTAAKASDISVDSTTQAVTFTSGTWAGLQGTGKMDGTDSTISVLGQDHNGKTFLVITLAPTATASSDGNTYFQPVLDSLSFLK